MVLVTVQECNPSFIYLLQGIFQDQTEAKGISLTHSTNSENGSIESLNVMTTDLKKEIQSIKGLLLSAYVFILLEFYTYIFFIIIFISDI